MIKIIIAQRGWVYVGRFERQGNHVVLTDGANVRRWGTRDKGLGYLAERGPTDDTVLDPCIRPIEMLELTTVAQHECNEEVWDKVLDDLELPE